MKSEKLNIDGYFKKGTFVIPNYQRGYKWPVNDKDGKNSLDYFISSLIDSFNNSLEEYFIEAVTIVEEEGTIILVDGQQRTTTLILLFVALGDIEFLKACNLIYEVRKDSHNHLNNLMGKIKENIEDDDVQDIFYFNEALKAINSILIGLPAENKNGITFLDFIKKNVFLLFNPIDKKKAINTFIALNGLKAIMKDEELIKSDLLIKSSRPEDKEHNLLVFTKCDTIEECNCEIDLLKNELSREWKINEDRGRLARNWDKWLYWWNQEDVKNYFGNEKRHPLYFLLVTYWNINKSEADGEKKFSFDNFKATFISPDTSNSASQNSKIHFEGLRKLQKTFEDLYNNFLKYNFLGLILKTSNSKEDALHYFLNSKNTNQILIEEYAKWSMVKATHKEIIENTIEKGNNNEDRIIKKRRAQDLIGLINEKYVYSDENEAKNSGDKNEFAMRFLMLLNLLEDNKLRRKFDFSIWANRSLEHIFPKSKKGYLQFDKPEFKEGSVHCIGNLVLLYGNNNSEFGAKDFNEKKAIYFDPWEEFKSRNLLHTVSVFAKPDWKEKDIIDNKIDTINLLNEYYGIAKQI